MSSPIRKIGFPCVLADGSLTTCHTFRLAALHEDRLALAVHQNLNDLESILAWMTTTPLRLFRLGSSLIPFASHREFKLDWRPLAGDRLRSIGNRFGLMGFRFSLHPGQYNVLNSPTPEAVAGCIRELSYSCEVLDLMGLDPSHKVVLHGGGLYGDRDQSTLRLIQRARQLPEGIRRRLVFENDERYFNLEQIVEISEDSGIPAVFDIHHHKINPVSRAQSLLERLRAVWDCVPKVHISSQKPGGRPGAHADFIDPADLKDLCALLPFEADLMVEAKSKDQAALQLVSEAPHALFSPRHG